MVNFEIQDEVVKLSPYARAIRDVEDEELRSFFYGMSPWQVRDFFSRNLFFFFFFFDKPKSTLLYVILQFMLIVAASSVGEELFYRAAVQVFLISTIHNNHDLTKLKVSII